MLPRMMSCDSGGFIVSLENKPYLVPFCTYLLIKQNAELMELVKALGGKLASGKD